MAWDPLFTPEGLYLGCGHLTLIVSPCPVLLTTGQGRANPLASEGNGYCSADVSGATARDQYRYL